jgi:imidazolonepropionase-like amidohydrolase
VKTSLRLQTLIASLLLVATVAAGQAQVTAIRAGRLVDPETGTAHTDRVILVEGSRITGVGADLGIPPGATVIDLSSSSVMPGLIDSHTHMLLTMDPEEHGGSYHVTSLVNSTAYRAIEGAANARSMLEHGFTTIRDLGNNGNHGDSDLRRAIEAGVVPGPTIVNSGRIIAPYGGQFQLQPERRDLAEPEYFFADTRDELIKAVRENIHYGAKVIKIVVDDQPYIYPVEDIELVVEEARRAGLQVAPHAVTERGFYNAAAAGVASIEHGFVASDVSLKRARKNRVVLVGTDLTELATQLWEANEIYRLAVIDRTRRARRIGVEMAFGSDVFYSWPGRTRGDLSLAHLDPYIEAGVTNEYLLRMLTVNGAKLLGLEATRARIAEGYYADIVAMPGNPLDDVTALREIHFVMKEGRVFRHDRTP